MATIICIDNDPTNSANISDVLTDAGYDILITGDGEQGLELILEHMPKLVLYNADTSGEERYRVLSEVREKYPLLAETPFLFLTPSSDIEQILADLEAGADAFLTNPVNPTLLLATVNASLRQIKRIKFKHERLLVLDI